MELTTWQKILDISPIIISFLGAVTAAVALLKGRNLEKANIRLTEENSNLVSKNAELSSANAADVTVGTALKLLNEIKNEVARLEKEIELLKKELAKYKIQVEEYERKVENYKKIQNALIQGIRILLQQLEDNGIPPKWDIDELDLNLD